MCQAGLRVNSSSVSTLGDPAKGKVPIQRRHSHVSYTGNCICVDQAAVVFLLPFNQTGMGSSSGKCYRVITSPFQAFSPLVMSTFVTKSGFLAALRTVLLFRVRLPTALLITRADRDVSKHFSGCACSLPKGLGPQDWQCRRCCSENSCCQEQNVSQRSPRTALQAKAPDY